MPRRQVTISASIATHPALRAGAQAALLAALAAACGPSSPGGSDPGLEGLALDSVNPGTVLPGTTLDLAGHSFVGPDYGQASLRLKGTFGPEDDVDVWLPARFVDYERMEVDWQGGLAAGLPAEEGVFSGEAAIEVQSSVDGELHESLPASVRLTLATSLQPSVAALQTGVIFVNDPIVVDGDGFLLGGDEGRTVAVVEGCFQVDGGASCLPVGPTAVEARTETPYDRSRVIFPFAPAIAGIRPGAFTGMVRVENRHGGGGAGTVLASSPWSADYQIVPPKIFRIAPTAASLGQYVEIQGGGFVGGDPALLTTLELVGTYTPEGLSMGTPVSLTLVPEYVSGPLVRYIVNEDDDLGTRVNLRQVAGEFRGTIRPVTQDAADRVVGDTTTVTLGIAHVKQVVWLNFLPSYVESLRHFGLRAMDQRIRQRVLEVARRDYGGVNVEVRTEQPDDFALYEQVDLSGPDPNGLGLLGYDNSPGKDVDNERLYDKIGGVNATTQQDGYPGFGGVFVESFFGFSEHPGRLADKLDGSDPLFDKTFDPFRPDRGGRPVLAQDLSGDAVPALTDGDSCPASPGDRSGQIACAVWVLGNMIGTTMTHEVGHSLGLANPHGEGFHDPGDQPNRLMDSGGGRTFTERAELQGDGPARFCDEAYEYLQEILPSDDPDPFDGDRPTCY